MNKKIFVQIALSLMIFLLIASSYFIFFKDNKIQNNKITSKTLALMEEEDNLINDLQYFSKDENGNSYLLNAESGYPDKNNSKIIYLTDVKALINFDNNNEVIVTSDNAVYNNSSYDTEFSKNVIIIYENNELTTRKMSALISQNLVILSGDIVYKNDFTNLYADQIEYDLIKRTSKISMYNKSKKVKITYINNGIN